MQGSNVLEDVKERAKKYVPDSFIREGLRFADKKEYDLAIIEYQKALKCCSPNYPGRVATIYYHKGNALFDLNKYEEADEAYQEAYKAFDKANEVAGYVIVGYYLTSLFRRRSSTLVYLKKYDELTKHICKMKDVYKKDLQEHDTYKHTVALMENGEYEKAIQWMRACFIDDLELHIM